MKILLTGASGFLGSHTAAELSRRGHEVFALVRKTSQTGHLQEKNIKLLQGSLSDLHALDAILPTVEVVVHIAGTVKALNTQAFDEVNFRGTENLVNKVLESPSPRKLFLHISTIAVHDPSSTNDFIA